MRIYLDSCVIQSLKDSNQEVLLNSIYTDKAENVYCYSEAHLLDLMRDKSNNKFSDLEFMEKIVDSNCWYYDKGIFFRHIRPVDYYDPFPEYQEQLFDEEEIFSEDVFPISFKKLFSAIPIDLMQNMTEDSLPHDFPNQLKYLLKRPTNLYDLICALGDFTNDLSNEQKDFRELISYFHKSEFSASIFETMDIKGFDGQQITNKEEFRNSYTKYFLNENQKKYRYDVFLEQYNGLEFFSIVKGKPKKQKMMNMINDGRHAFFGAFCDIVVSKDVDFINKTKFLYDVHDIETMVINMDKFLELLEKNKTEKVLSFEDMLGDGNDIQDERVIVREENHLLMTLKHVYFSYFNAVHYVVNEIGSFSYYSKNIHNMSSVTLINEFKFITENIVKVLGADSNGNTSFDMSEIKDNKWIGRMWWIADTIVELNFENKINLAFYPVEYFKNAIEKQTDEK